MKSAGAIKSVGQNGLDLAHALNRQSFRESEYEQDREQESAAHWYPG